MGFGFGFGFGYGLGFGVGVGFDFGFGFDLVSISVGLGLGLVFGFGFGFFFQIRFWFFSFRLFMFWNCITSTTHIVEQAQREIEKALNAATKRQAITSLEKDYDVRFYHYNGLPPAGPRMCVVSVSRRVRLEANPEEDKQILVRWD
jgi:hypothetical protein